MKNLTGTWIGTLDGTNSGSMTVILQHEGDRIYGTGNFNEASLASYQYSISGIVKDTSLSLFLSPASQLGPELTLGNVEAQAEILSNEDEVKGQWKSNIGTFGDFILKKPEINSDDEKSEKFSNAVFIIHGHDEVSKEKVARFIENLGIKAIVLHEQVNQGMTLIEKFEEYSRNVGFAIALFTPDDVAYPLGNVNLSKPRARQNVVLEMGYFVGLLGRKKVAVLYKGNVELPSDILNMVYTSMDENGGWKLSIAKELKQAGYNVDLNLLSK